jgi:Predicted enzyme related to lactoylglutathione lyase
MDQVQLGYFTLATPDIDRARAFYAALFDWTFAVDPGHPTYAHVTGSNPPFGFVLAEAAPDQPNLYFRVTDIGAVCERAVSLGGRAMDMVQTVTGFSCVCTDDQGVSFSLWQAAPGL